MITNKFRHTVSETNVVYSLIINFSFVGNDVSLHLPYESIMYSYHITPFYSDKINF